MPDSEEKNINPETEALDFKSSFPSEDDVNANVSLIKSETKSVQFIIALLFFGSALLEFFTYKFIRFEGAIFFHIGVSVLLSLAVISLVISISVRTKPLLITKVGDGWSIFKASLPSWPRVFATTVALFCMVLIALPLFILPAIYVLFSFIRAPYNAALGHSISEAFKLSLLDRKRFWNANIWLTITVVNALFSIGFLVLVFEMLEPWIPWGMSDLVFHSIKASIWFGIWLPSLAICIVADEFFLEPKRKYKPMTPINKLRNGVSKLGPALVFAVFFVLTQTDFQKPVSNQSASIHEIEWEMETLAGTMIQSQTYDDKPIVIYAWAPWCLPCKIQTPHIKKLYEEKGNQYHVLSVALSYKTRKRVVEYAQDYALPYPAFYGTHAFQEITQVNAFPTTMIIKDKKVVQQWTGVTSTRRIKNALSD